MSNENEIQITCGLFRSKLYHFQADELPADERGALQAHLSACPGCARLLEVEDGLLRGLKGRLRRATPPAGLEDRIRESLRVQATRAWPARVPWLAAVAASLLLAALLVPALGRFPALAEAGVVRVDELVMLVDRACDKAGRTLEQQRKCRARDHVNVFKTGDGSYWMINLNRPEVVALAHEPELRGHRFEVRGELYSKIGTVQIDAFRDLGLILEAAESL